MIPWLDYFLRGVDNILMRFHDDVISAKRLTPAISSSMPVLIFSGVANEVHYYCMRAHYRMLSISLVEAFVSFNHFIK